MVIKTSHAIKANEKSHVQTLEPCSNLEKAQNEPEPGRTVDGIRLDSRDGIK